MGLSKKEQAFTEYYLLSWNATEAARKAGYSERSARSIGHENLTKPDIREVIDRRLSELCMSSEEALTHLATQARFDLSPYIEYEAGNQPVVNLKKLIADGHGRLIKSLKRTKYGTQIEFESKFNALARILDDKGRALNRNDDNTIHIVLDR